jgi:sugar phosphate isomerase/epimerase
MTDLEIGLCWGTLRNADLLGLIEAAGRHGFPTLSVQPAAVFAAVETIGEAGLRRRLADAKVRVRVIDALAQGLPGMPAPATSGPAAGLLADSRETCFRAAEIVGAPIVNVAHFGGKPVPRSQMADALGDISREAAGRGLQIVLEFIPDTGFPNLGEALALVQAVALPNIAILLDTWHLARSGGTVEDVRALPPGAIGALQLSDRTPPPPGTPYVPMTGRDLPGEGQLPLFEIVRAALANSPGLTAEIEVFSEELRAMSPDAAAARTASAVKAWRDAQSSSGN